MIDKLKQVKTRAENLRYKDDQELDDIVRKTKMYVDKMFLKASPKSGTVKRRIINLKFFGEMKKSRFSEVQIIKVLKELESGRSVNDLAREHSVSQATIYNWKSKYGGMEVSQLKKIKEMEAELAQFKKIVADLTLQNHVLKDVIEKKL